MQRARTRRTAAIQLIEFLRPDPFWPWPYSLEMGFQALRWLIASAADPGFVEHHQWHTSCAVGLMGGEGAQNGACRPITSIDDLKQRFVYALLGSDRHRPEVTRWREQCGIHPGAQIPMQFRHYKPHYPASHLPWRSEAQIREALTALLENSVGQRLNVQLNSVHRRARVVQRVGIYIGPKRFRFVLNYGFNDARKDPCASTWSQELATSKGDEPFLDVLARAIEQFTSWTHVPALQGAA